MATLTRSHRGGKAYGQAMISACGKHRGQFFSNDGHREKSFQHPLPSSDEFVARGGMMALEPGRKGDGAWFAEITRSAKLQRLPSSLIESL